MKNAKHPNQEEGVGIALGQWALTGHLIPNERIVERCDMRRGGLVFGPTGIYTL